MLIGELSRRTGVNPHQLRYYEAQGLLEPGRGSSGYREYAEDAVVTVTQIRRLLDAGLSTLDIEYLLPCAAGTAPDLVPCPELTAFLHTRLQRLDAQIDTLTRSRQALRDYLAATARPAAAPHPAPDYPVCEGTGPPPVRRARGGPGRSSHGWREWAVTRPPAPPP